MHRFLMLALALSTSSFAAILDYWAPLTPQTSGATGTGVVNVSIDTTLNLLSISTTWSGLSGLTTAAHIHCCTAVPLTGNVGVASTTPSFAGFPLGVSSGNFSNALDLTLASSWNPAYITNNGGTTTSATAALLAGIADGSSYFQIHTNTFPGGELRGYLQPVPEPGTVALMLCGLTLLPLLRRR